MTARIPPIVKHRVSERARETLDIVARFVDEECIPADAVFDAQLGRGGDGAGAGRFAAHPPVIDHLKARARELGLWNLFLTRTLATHCAGAGAAGSDAPPAFTNVEYGLMAEHLGRSRVAPEATNCAAPDTGNMEVLARYGTAAQRAEWLEPLLDGHIRSAFLMTEPDVASSDARNVQLEMRREGDEYVLTGQKWWSSGAGDPRCRLYIVVGRTGGDRHSVMLVPVGSAGIVVRRMLSVYGYDDAPHGHGHVSFDHVRVPAGNLVLGEGRGLEIIQGRLGPGRIHHAMRTVGAAERALDWMLMRASDPARTPFGRRLRDHDVILSWVAEARIEIDAARLVVLSAAAAMDDHDDAAQDHHDGHGHDHDHDHRHRRDRVVAAVSQAKVLAPRAALAVIDRAVQTFGGAGVSQDTPLAAMWAAIRTLRLADGPDEVHLRRLGRMESRRGDEAAAQIARQMAATERLMERYELGPKPKL